MAKTEKQIPEKLGVQFRAMAMGNAPAMDDEKRTVSLSFSSEEPYLRWFGYEILSHDPKSVRMDRLNQGAALLCNHDPECHIGVVEAAKLDGKIGKADVRFGKGAMASEKFQDVKDGILRNTSVGYKVNHMTLMETKEDGPDTYLVDDWEPVEISLVAVPADPTVGVGRDLAQEFPVLIDRSITASADKQEQQIMATTAVTPATSAVDVKPNESAEIFRLGKSYNVDVEPFLRDGLSLAQAKEKVADVVLARAQAAAVKPTVDMSEKEKQNYSIARAILSAGKGTPCFEREVSNELAKKLDRQAEGNAILVPTMGTRAAHALNVTTTAQGKETIQTNVMDLIEIFRNKMVLQRAGIRTLNGLKGLVSFPRHTLASVPAYKAEAAAATQSDITFDSVSMAPKRATVYTNYSIDLLLQATIDVEGFVRTDLGAGIAHLIDKTGLYNASNPTGIYNTTGINTSTYTTTSASTKWASVVGMETECAIDDADVDNMVYITTPEVRGLWKTTPRGTNTIDGNIWEKDNTVNGYRGLVTNALPKTLTSANHAVLYGNFADAILGFWDGLEIVVDPYTLSKEAQYVVIARQYYDVAVRHATSFCTMELAVA